MFTVQRRVTNISNGLRIEICKQDFLLREIESCIVLVNLMIFCEWFLKQFIINLICILIDLSCFDDLFLAYLHEVDQHQETLRNDADPVVKRRALMRVQQALIAAQEIGDEKLQIVQQVQDLIENKSRQLDVDYRNLGIFYTFFK